VQFSSGSTYLDDRNGSVTATPDVRLRLCTQRPGGSDLSLASLRCVIVGGEIVRAETLRAFETALARGFRSDSLCPA
jgi:hypothetical protein